MIRPSLLGSLASLMFFLIAGSTSSRLVLAERDLAVLLPASDRAFARGQIDTSIQPSVIIDGWPCANQLPPPPLPVSRAGASYYAFDTGHDDNVIIAEQYESANDARAAVEFEKTLVDRCNNSIRVRGETAVTVEMHGNPVNLTNNLDMQVADDAYRADATEWVGSTAVAYTEDFILLKGDTVVRLHKNPNTGRNPWTFGQLLFQLVVELDARLAE